MREIKTRELTFKVRDDTPFVLGQKIYKVERVASDKFESKCPVCDDTRTVVVKGYACKCPYCSNSHEANLSSVWIYRYAVKEYIINRVEIEGSQYKKGYGDNVPDKYLPTVRYSAFKKEGAYITSTVIGMYNFTNPRDTEFPSFFFKKSEAESACKQLNAQAKESLTDFNKRNGTSHEYPYE